MKKEEKIKENLKKDKQKDKENSKKKQVKPIIEKIDKEFKSKQKMPKEQEEKINKIIFNNILIAIGVMLYFYFINLGSINIEPEIFLTDLKVFSMGILLLAILLFEISYKKDDGKMCIYGIETLVVAIISLFALYIYSIYRNYFHFIIAYLSLLLAIYYVGKSIVIYKKMEKEYYKSLSDIGEIVKKEIKKK